MDRLPLVRTRAPRLLIWLAVAGLTGACGGTPDVGRSRVEGVRSSNSEQSPERWLDVAYAPGQSPAFALPRVVAARAGHPVPALRSGQWTWVNLWATWCAPCRREMPLLLTWRDQLEREGVSFDLWFLSIDDTQADLERFLTVNPAVAPDPSVRLAARKELEGWLRHFPGAPTDTVPLQILVAPDGTVRGLRAGALREGDYPTVKALLTR